MGEKFLGTCLSKLHCDCVHNLLYQQAMKQVHVLFL